MIRLALSLMLLAVPALAQSVDEIRLDDVSKLLDMRERQLIEIQKQANYWKDACLSTAECGGPKPEAAKQP